MQGSAQVQSLAAIDAFRAALAHFGDEAGQALSNLRMDVQRFVEWLEHDQLIHWQHEIRRREERVAEAKNDLHRCLSATIDPRRTPSCYQEKKVLAAAKARLEEAEEKLAAVRRWIPQVQQAVFQFLARTQPLADALASDLPSAIAHLRAIVGRLEEYLAVEPPAGAAGARTSQAVTSSWREAKTEPVSFDPDQPPPLSNPK